MNQENLPVTPINSFGYQRIVAKRAHFVHFQLAHWYNDLSYLEGGLPRCDLTPTMTMDWIRQFMCKRGNG